MSLPMFNLVPNQKLNQGFTLIELLVIIIIIGVLAAVATPSWFSFLERQRLNTAQGEIFRAIQKAQQQAKQENKTFYTQFREQGGKAQWRVGNADQAGTWTSLNEVVAIDETNTTFKSENPTGWEVEFNYKGRAIGDEGVQNGKITLTADNTSAKRCVIVSSILGSVREAKDEDC